MTKMNLMNEGSRDRAILGKRSETGQRALVHGDVESYYHINRYDEIVRKIVERERERERERKPTTMSQISRGEVVRIA